MLHEDDKDAPTTHSYFDIFGMMMLTMVTGLVCYILMLEPESDMIIFAALWGMGFVLLTLVICLLTGWTWIASFIDSFCAFLTVIFMGFMIYALFFSPDVEEKIPSDADVATPAACLAPASAQNNYRA